MLWNYEHAELKQFTSYKAYLLSKYWRRIRGQVIKSKGTKCWMCMDSKATEIHHADYEVETMIGESLKGLFPMCRHCHRDIHVGRTVSQANEMLKNSRDKTIEAMHGCCGGKRKAVRKTLAKKLKRRRQGDANRKLHEKAAANWR